MSARYFAASAEDEEDRKDKKKKSFPKQEEEVYHITSSAINRAKKQVSYNQRAKKRKFTTDAFPGPAPVDPAALERHSRGNNQEGGDTVRTERVKTKFARKQQERRERTLNLVTEVSARTELLLDGEEGFLEGDRTDEFTSSVTQTQIRRAVDEESAAKGFDLNLQQFGPYKVDYTRNGRHLLIGGRRGHIAAFDWITKRLLCEISVQEAVNDVKWLHTENLFAVAQRGWTYIYDNQGIEIHCLKKLDNITHLEFLPYHFLLASLSERGFLSWVDVSVGKMVNQFPTKLGRCSDMCQNPWNGVMCLSHSKGIVTMWTPNAKEPVAKMLAHRQAVTALTVDPTGNYLATAAVDRSLKIWDVRQFKCVQDYKISSGASRLHFSGRGLLGVALGDSVEILKDCCVSKVQYPYMRHKVNRSVADIQFAPYEDVMGIGHAGGFTSILVPGSGDANFDALEVNPYQTKTQRREAEVKSLLEKIQPDLISLDPDKLGEVDLPTLEEKVAERNSKLHAKPANIDFEPRMKTKGKGGTAKRFHVKRTVVEEERMRGIKNQLEAAKEIRREGPAKKKKEPKTLLDRLK